MWSPSCSTTAARGRSCHFGSGTPITAEDFAWSLAKEKGIKQGDKVIERLQPRLESAPEMLFAEAPTLPPGDYTLHWAVITLQGEKTTAGDIPFQVSDQPPK